VGEVIQVVLASVFRATTKKVVNFFGEEKCTPGQNPGYAYDSGPFVSTWTHPWTPLPTW